MICFALLGETELHRACIRNEPAKVKQLLLNDFNPNLKDNAGWTALHEASNHGHTACVAELLKSKGIVFYLSIYAVFCCLQNSEIEKRTMAVDPCLDVRHQNRLACMYP